MRETQAERERALGQMRSFEGRKWTSFRCAIKMGRRRWMTTLILAAIPKLIRQAMPKRSQKVKRRMI